VFIFFVIHIYTYKYNDIINSIGDYMLANSVVGVVGFMKCTLKGASYL